MREDLDFLYQKAMRSKDVEFIEWVFRELIHTDNWDKRGDNLSKRIIMMQDGWYPAPTLSDKFDFLVGDSQMGENWYRNR